MSDTLLLTSKNDATGVSISNNDNNTPFVDTAHEVSVYRKILDIHGQIFSGTHPRLKVPQHALRKPNAKSTVPSLLGPPAAQAGPSTADIPKDDNLKDDLYSPDDTSPVAIEKNDTHATSSSDPAQITAPSQVTATTTGPQVLQNKPPATNIDPIFLTEAPVVTRAKVQLQRDKLEKQVSNQTFRGKSEHRLRLSANEQNPPFDVDEVYAQALSVVQPVPPPNEEDAVVGSSDAGEEEEPYYSSQGPNSPHPLIADDDHYSPVPPDTNTFAGTESARITGNRPSTKTKQAPFGQVAQETDPYYSPHAVPQVLEEPEYSPPEPDAPLSSGDAIAPELQAAPLRGQGVPRYQPPLPDAPIFENYITSPVGPGPSQIAPMAQNFQPYGANAAQPARTNEFGHGRKRRRQQQQQQQQQHQALPQVSANTPRVGQKLSSPSVQVKAEPVSPSFIAPPVRNMSILSKPPNRPLSRYEASQHLPVHDNAGYNQSHVIDREPAPYRPAYGFSRPIRDGSYSQRHPLRSRHRLQQRAAASPIHARSKLARAQSRAPSVVDARYEDDFEQSGVRHYDPDYVLPPSPKMQREASVYADPVEPEMSKRRVIVDEQGNRYIEADPTPRRAPVLAPGIRDPYIRTGGYPLDEEDGIPDYLQHSRRDPYSDMPPPFPAPVCRRIVDYDPRDGSIVSERKVFLREPDYDAQYMDYQHPVRATSRAPPAMPPYSRHQPQISDEFDDIQIPPPSRRNMGVEPYPPLRNVSYGDYPPYQRAASIVPGYGHDIAPGPAETIYDDEPSQLRYREPYPVRGQTPRGVPRYGASKMRTRNERVQATYPEREVIPPQQHRMVIDDEYDDDADREEPMGVDEYGPFPQARSLRRY